MLKLVACVRYAAAARSSMCTSTKTSCLLNPPKRKSRESARIGTYLSRQVRWAPVDRIKFDSGLDCPCSYVYVFILGTEDERWMWAIKARNGGKGEGSRTEVETPYVLEALAAIATSNDDHDTPKIGRMISVQ